MNEIIIDTAKLDELIKKSPDLVDKAIRATAFDVETDAKLFAEPSVDTGAMRASIFTKTSTDNGYSKAAGEARDKRPGVEVNDPTPGTPPKMTAYVAPGVSYAGFVEFGSGRQSPQPYMTPAVEKADVNFAKHIKQVFQEDV